MGGVSEMLARRKEGEKVMGGQGRPIDCQQPLSV